MMDELQKFKQNAHILNLYRKNRDNSSAIMYFGMFVSLARFKLKIETQNIFISTRLATYNVNISNYLKF